MMIGDREQGARNLKTNTKGTVFQILQGILGGVSVQEPCLALEHPCAALVQKVLLFLGDLHRSNRSRKSSQIASMIRIFWSAGSAFTSSAVMMRHYTVV
jgi:hypothetical protein